MHKYHSEDEIKKVVESFENGTISRSGWRHAEHLVAANYYLSTTTTLSDAYDKMRGGIFNLLKAFAVDLEKEMPYHETLTMFWLKTVDEFRKRKNGCSLLEITNELTETFDKDYPLKFYSRELLFSDEARARFVEADLSTTTVK